MARLPTPGADNGTWGEVLNAFLQVEHNTDGTLKTSGSLAGKANDSEVVKSVNGVEPDSTGLVSLAPEDIGLVVDAVTPSEIGAIAFPSGGTTNDVLTLSAPGTATWQAPSGGANMDGGTLIEDLSFWPYPRKDPKPKAFSSIITQFQSGHGWTLTAGNGGTMTDDTTTFAMGSQSLRIDAGIHASTLTYVTSPTLSSTVDLTQNYLELLLSWPTSGIGQLVVEVSSNDGATWVQCNTSSRGGIQELGTWVPWRLHRGSFSNSATNFGTTTWTAINRVRVGARTSTTESAALSVRLQQLAVAASPTKGMLSIFMEGWTELYTYARIFNERGIKPLVAIRAGAIETSHSSVMTADQLRELHYTYGWDVAPLCYERTDIDNGSLGATNMEISIAKAMHWLRKNGLPFETGWFRTGSWNTTTNNASIAARKYSNISVANNDSNMVNVFPTANPRNAYAHHIFGSSALSAAQAYLDKVEACRGWGTTFAVRLVGTATSNANINVGVMASILDYALTKNIDIVPYSEVMERW